MSPKRPVAGILWVNSDVIQPERLTKERFNTWYCNEHIPDVVAKSGVENAVRYEHVVDCASPGRRLGFLTIYGMPDIDFMKTHEFRSLEGQSPGPSREIIFENAEFDTRSYELVQTCETRRAKAGESLESVWTNSSDLILGPAPLLLCAAISHSSDTDLDEWYRREHVDLISKCPGHRRTTRYKLATSSTLSAFKRSFPGAPTWLALHEFDGPEMPWKELAATDETTWAKKVIPGILEVDFGCFRLKKDFGKSEKSNL